MADDAVADILVVGAGTAGLPLAIEAAARGAKVIVIDQAADIGGTLHVSAGHLSGAGTKLQRDRGIADSADAHFHDVMRISHGTARADLVRRAVALQGATIDWLMDNGFDLDPQCPAILYFHEAYRTPRTYWGNDGGRSVLDVLRPLFEAVLAGGNAVLRLRTRALRLNMEGGTVTGMHVRDLETGEENLITARNLVLTSGGHGANAALFAELTAGLPLYSAAMPLSDGSGMELAREAGAMLCGGEHFLPTFAGIGEQPDGRTVLWDHLPVLTPQSRAPWEIYVDSTGNRFVREDVDSVDARERALLRTPGLTFWAVFDERIRQEAPPLLPGWTCEELAAAWESHPSFTRADTLEALAGQAGIDPSLVATVADYNAALVEGRPDPLGKLSRPRPITQAPFHAIRMHGVVLKTAAGILVDTQLRVLDPAGEPVPGLYAIGEVIGGGALSGNAFVGGMSVTPALAFGRALGAELAATSS